MQNCISTRVLKSNQITGSQQHVLIYKTKNDYYLKVPIILSEDKKTIVSYPHPSDLNINGKYCLPTKLEGGYLLDNRGVNFNVVFIKMDYVDYSKLNTPPEMKELFNMIIDIDPLIELYDCGLRSKFKDIEKELNAKIIEAKFAEFKKIK